MVLLDIMWGKKKYMSEKCEVTYKKEQNLWAGLQFGGILVWFVHVRFSPFDQPFLIGR